MATRTQEEGLHAFVTRLVTHKPRVLGHETNNNRCSCQTSHSLRASYAPARTKREPRFLLFWKDTKGFSGMLAWNSGCSMYNSCKSCCRRLSAVPSTYGMTKAQTLPLLLWRGDCCRYLGLTYLRSCQEHDPVPHRWQQVIIDAGVTVVLIQGPNLQVKNLLGRKVEAAVGGRTGRANQHTCTCTYEHIRMIVQQQLHAGPTEAANEG